MQSPYQGLPSWSFWRTGVAAESPTTIDALYRKRFPIAREMRVATAGSCFAQHISRYLQARDFNVIDTEPAPEHLPPEDKAKFGYGLYSARYGNIYYVRQLLQLAQEAFGQFVPANSVWEKEGRYYDALRPSVEPQGLDSPEAVALHRQSHLRHVRQMFLDADVFVFTFGLTEGWIDRATGTTYPTAPGTIAGSFDGDAHEFKNFSFNEILDDFETFRALVKEQNPQIKFLITVSPVPLTATASGHHVLSATTYSKSVLRAVAGELYNRFADVDYFPSYEIIASPFSRAAFYESNLRSVSESGVEAVMRVFFQEHEGAALPADRDVSADAERVSDAVGTDAPPSKRRARSAKAKKGRSPRKRKKDAICEEILLDAFSR